MVWQRFFDWIGGNEVKLDPVRHTPKQREISQSGLDLIKKFEGLRLVAYQDSVGIWTIGYGHTAGVKKLDTCTAEQAEQWLKEDVTIAELAVDQLTEIPLTQNQFDALVSLVFNIGVRAFKKSTLLKCINQGDFEMAADQFLVWNKGTINGKKVVLNGLANRRAAERELFLA